MRLAAAREPLAAVPPYRNRDRQRQLLASQMLERRAWLVRLSWHEAGLHQQEVGAMQRSREVGEADDPIGCGHHAVAVDIDIQHVVA